MRQKKYCLLLHTHISWEQLNSDPQIKLLGIQTRIKKKKKKSTDKHWSTCKAAIIFKTLLYHRQSFLNHVHHTVTSAAANFKTTWFMQIMQTTVLETEIWDTHSRNETLHLCNLDFILQCNQVDEGWRDDASDGVYFICWGCCIFQHCH